MVLRDAVSAVGLPFVAEAAWRSPTSVWMGFDDRLEAVAVAGEVVATMRRRIAVGDRLRDAAWRCVIAGLSEQRRQAWPPGDPGDDAGMPLPGGGGAGPKSPGPDASLVIRRRGEGGRHDAK
jgi:hypothetical protein